MTPRSKHLRVFQSEGQIQHVILLVLCLWDAVEYFWLKNYVARRACA